VGSDGGSIALLLDLEDGTLVGVLQLGTIELVEGLARALGEVTVDLGVTESRVGLAVCEVKSVYNSTWLHV
jgi:hypothetical protein